VAWDANRPVPWRRLIREASIFVVIGGLAIAFLVRHPKPSDYFGLVVGMIFYVGVLAVLAKFGYHRQSFGEARAKRRTATSPPAAAAAQPGARARPAPTKRTSTGPSQRPNRSTKKRRR
jgi:hypothetical protein